MEPERGNAVVTESVEKQIDEWRSYLRRSRAITTRDAAELEDHLREQMATLSDEGLAQDEAFLVAVKRMGAIDALTREFAREHSERLWKQLVLPGEGAEGAAGSGGVNWTRRMWVAIGLAVAAAVAIKLPALFNIRFPMEDAPPTDEAFYMHNIAFFILPFVAAYFAWERPVARGIRFGLAAAFGAAALVANLYPFSPGPSRDTEILSIIHMPIALWLAVGVAYVGGKWRGNERRMDFIRFTGELFIYFVLTALGGIVLTGVTVILFQAIRFNIQPFVAAWLVPCGIAGAAVVATWLVEAKQSVIENMAPVLTRIFTPLFALLLLAFLGTMVATGRGIHVEREILIGFDLLLVVVFALLLYSFSARDPLARPSLLDWIQLTLVVTALVVDVLALWAVGSRISSYGWTPNRVAALGENIVLLVNLAGSALLHVRFLRGGGAFTRVWGWQMAYVYVLAGWAAVVAVLFPPLFGFR